jgi:uncharacterized membrane protein
MNLLSAVGRTFFGLGLIASGLQQIFRQEFVRLVPPIPGWIPAHSILAVLIGGILVIAGTAIVANRPQARTASALVALMLLAMLLLLYVPQIATNPKAGFMWTNPCKVLALFGGCILLISIAPKENTNPLRIIIRLFAKLAFLSPILVSIFFVLGGIQHFVYAGFVDTLVPAWIQPNQRFWTCFAGVALIAGGLGLLIPRFARLAATWSGIMIFLWVILLHMPRAFADLKQPGETSAIFEALALSGVAFLLAGTRPKTPSEKQTSLRSAPSENLRQSV